MPKISAETYAARRRHILDAARDRFALAGIHISIDEVCAAAGVSKGAFYGYFRSKDALFEALAEDHGERLEVQSPPCDPPALVRMLAERLSLDNPAYARLELDTWAHAMRHAPLNAAFARNTERLRRTLAEALGVIEPRARIDSDIGAAILQFAVQGAFLHLALNGSTETPVIRAAIEALVEMLSARE